MKKYVLFVLICFSTVHPMMRLFVARFQGSQPKNRIAEVVEAEEAVERAMAYKCAILAEHDSDVVPCAVGDLDACARLVERKANDLFDAPSVEEGLCHSMYYLAVLEQYKKKCIAQGTQETCEPLIALMRSQGSGLAAEAIEKEVDKK